MTELNEVHHVKGLLFDASPMKVTASDVIAEAREYDNPVIKDKLIFATEAPSPNSMYVSHSSSNLKELGILAEGDGVKEIISRLEKPNLLSSEKVIRTPASSLSSMRCDVALLKALVLADTSPFVLSLECLKLLESDVGRLLKKRMTKLSSEVLSGFSQIVKDFLKLQGLKKKVPSATSMKVCKRCDVGRFAATICHFVKHYEAYKDEGGVPFTKEAAQVLIRHVLALYQQIMIEYLECLEGTPLSLSKDTDPWTSLVEWQNFELLRSERNWLGGHPPVWQQGVPGEIERLVQVTDLFAQIVQHDVPVLKPFGLLKQLVVPYMQRHIKEKEATKCMKAPGIDMSFADAEDLRQWV